MTDWSQYKVDEPSSKTDWSQYKVSDQPERQQQSLFSKFKDYEKGGAVGLVQGLGDAAVSAFNFPGELYEAVGLKHPLKLPHPDLTGYYPQSEEGQFGGSVGSFGGETFAPGAGALSAIKSVNNPFAKMLLGALSAGATNAATHEGNRAESGVEGVAAGLIPGIGSLVKAPLSKTIAGNLLKDKDAVKSLYNAKYTGLFDQAAQQGITHVSIPKININTIKDSGMPKYYKSLQKFMTNPTLENAHWAQSELGGLERNLQKVAERTGLTPAQTKAYNEAIKAKEKIRKVMFSEHNLGSQPELAKTYEKLTHGYKQDVIPWNSAKGLEDFRRGKLKASSLTKKLISNDEFLAQLGGNYPSLKINKTIRNPWLQNSLWGGLGLETAHKLYQATE